MPQRVHMVKRYIASEMLMTGNVAVRHGIAEFWRATNTFKAGLTPKEKAYVDKRVTQIQVLCDEIHQVHVRTRQSSRTQ
jgi:hypothetical protein